MSPSETEDRRFNVLTLLNRLNYFADDELAYHLESLSAGQLQAVALHRWTTPRILRVVNKLIAEKNSPAPAPQSQQQQQQQ